MDAFGIETVDRIRLAGAFGAHIDPVHAMVLGLVPDCDPEHVTSAGNAAGTGARIALLNRASREEIEAVVRRVEKLETAVEPRFQEHFVERWASRTPPIRSRGWAPSSIFRHGASSRRATAPAPRTHQPTREEQHVSDDTGATSEATPRRRRTGGRRTRGRTPRRRRRTGALHHPGTRRSRW